MKWSWRTKAHEGDRRRVRKFAWLPVRLVDNSILCLERYVDRQIYTLNGIWPYPRWYSQYKLQNFSGEIPGEKRWIGCSFLWNGICD